MGERLPVALALHAAARTRWPWMWKPERKGDRAGLLTGPKGGRWHDPGLRRSFASRVRTQWRGGNPCHLHATRLLTVAWSSLLSAGRCTMRDNLGVSLNLEKATRERTRQGRCRLDSPRGMRMNVFDLHGRLIEDYRLYVESFIQIKDETNGRDLLNSRDCIRESLRRAESSWGLG